MKTLIAKLNRESKVELKKSLSFNEEKKDVKSFLDYAYYRGLFSKKEIKGIEEMTFSKFKKVLVSKIKEKSALRLSEKIKEVKSVENKLFKITEIKITVEWAKSKMWGLNPTAEVWVSFKDAKGNTDCEYFKSRYVSGCGYDKLSTAIAEALNQSDVLKANLYKSANKNKSNRDIFGYGSGYGVLPYFEGGVGVSCYPSIFKAIGLKWQSVAGGKMFDIYNVSRIK